MGQQQSAPAPRRSANRLSKPKTNTSTSNLLSKSNLQLDRRESQLHDVFVVNNRHSVVSIEAIEELEKPKTDKKVKQSKRRSLFRSKTAQEPELEFPSTARSKEQVAEPLPTERSSHRFSVHTWSRTSLVTESSSVVTSQKTAEPVEHPTLSMKRSRMSVQHVPHNQRHPRLSLVAEAPTPLIGSDTRRLSFYNQETLSPQLNNPLNTRTNSDTDLYAPIRRRSLLQPGIATRSSYLDNDSPNPILSQFDTQDDPDNYCHESDSTGLAPLESFARIRDREIHHDRVETPDDLEYRHIGAFKLGSLRIMNGVASPSPSLENSLIRDDHVQAGRRSAEGKKHRRGLSNRSTAMFLAEPDTDSEGDEYRPETPTRQSRLPVDDRRHSGLDASLPPLDPSLALFDFDTSSDTFRLRDTPQKGHSRQKSEDLASEYMQDLALSPYSFDPSRPSSPAQSPQLEPTSKNTAIEDELFDAEPLTPSLSHVDSGYGSYRGPSRRLKGKREKTLAKADSGYSSNVSLRSFRTNTSISTPSTVPIKEAPTCSVQGTVSRAASSSYSFTSATTETTINAKRSLLNISADRSSPPIPSGNAQITPIELVDDSHSSDEALPPLTPVKSPRQAYLAVQGRPKVVLHSKHKRQKSLPNDSIDKQDERNAGTEKSRWRLNRKEKNRPKSMMPLSPPTVFSVRADDDTTLVAPPVPKEAAVHLQQRVDAFPVTTFSNTFNGLRRTSSKATLGTIFSVGSGFTEAPIREQLTQKRLQEELPPPPPSPPKKSDLNTSALTSNSYLPLKTPPKKLKKRSSIQEFSPTDLPSIQSSMKSYALEASRKAQSTTSLPEPAISKHNTALQDAAKTNDINNSVQRPSLDTRRSSDSITSKVAKGNWPILPAQLPVFDPRKSSESIKDPSIGVRRSSMTQRPVSEIKNVVGSVSGNSVVSRQKKISAPGPPFNPRKSVDSPSVTSFPNGNWMGPVPQQPMTNIRRSSESIPRKPVGSLTGGFSHKPMLDYRKSFDSIPKAVPVPMLPGSWGGPIGPRPMLDSRKSMDSLPRRPSAGGPRPMLDTRKSMDSIPRPKPFLVFDAQSNTVEYAPHVAPHIAQVQQQRRLSESSRRESLDDQEKEETDGRKVTWTSRGKTTPPISMQNQRKLASINHGVQNITQRVSPLAPELPKSDDRNLLPSQKSANRSGPSSPQVFTPPALTPSADWTVADQQSQYFGPQSVRRSLTAEADQVLYHKSVESIRSRRPGIRRPPSTHLNSNLKMRKSLDAIQATRAKQHWEQQMALNLNVTSLESSENSQAIHPEMVISPNLKSYSSYDGSPQQQPLYSHRSSEFSQDNGEGQNFNIPKFNRNGEYNHTYGFGTLNQETRSSSPEKEYYETESESYESVEHKYFRSLHQSQSSTSDMLAFDQILGGLDYGYQHVNGSSTAKDSGAMNGVQGGRKKMDLRRSYGGLDLTGVPVMQQRMRVLT